MSYRKESRGISSQSKRDEYRKTPNSQSAVKEAYQKVFPQQGYLLVLFGILSVVGSIAALAFKTDSSMFMQILYLVGASCGIEPVKEVVKHFKS
ncbi:MAG TPA: hypothetical protein VGL94_05850 [Ktedonobacteraceae bacterium]|jgi:hypothetical protein